MAPAEGNTPIPINQDIDAERLSFPTIYCGQRSDNPDSVQISCTDRYKSILRRYDRRGAGPEHTLYMFKYFYNEKVRSAVQIPLRQRKRGDRDTPLVAGELKISGTIPSIIASDNGYQIYKTIRGSPPYWAHETKRTVAMVRQLGAATFFITTSAAEHKCTDLLVTLYKLAHSKCISNKDASKLSYNQRVELVRSDHSTCIRHFERRCRKLL